MPQTVDAGRGSGSLFDPATLFLFPSDPFDKYRRWDKQLRRYIDELGRIGPHQDPRADVEETDDAYIVDVDLPGVPKDNVKVSVSDQRLRVSGGRPQRRADGILRQKTRDSGPFDVEITLPGKVDAETATASLESGVLTVNAPKAESDKTRRVELRR